MRPKFSRWRSPESAGGILQATRIRSEQQSYSLMQRLWSVICLVFVLLAAPAMMVGLSLGVSWSGIAAAALFAGASLFCAYRLRADLMGMLPLMVIFVCFVAGYLVKYVDRGLSIGSGEAFEATYSAIPPAVRALAYNKEHLVFALFLAGLGLAAFAFVVFFLPVSRKRVRLDLEGESRLERACLPLLFGALGLGVVLSVVSARYGIGMMHIEQEELPFKLTGIINYTRSALPLCLILIFFLAWEKRSTRLIVLSSIGLLFYALMGSLSTGSRGALLVPVIFSILYSIIYGKINHRGVLVFAILLVMYSALRLVLSQYRDYMVEAGGASEFGTSVKMFGFAIVDVLTHSTLIDAWRMIFAVMDRVQGLDGLLFLSIEPPRYDLGLTIKVFTNEFHLARYLTDEVMEFQITSGRTHGAAVGMLGAFYFLGGIGGLAVGVCAFAVAMQSIYSAIIKRALWVQPLGLCFIAYLSFQFFSEANLGTIIKDQLFAVALFFGLEIYFRRLLGQPKVRPMGYVRGGALPAGILNPVPQGSIGECTGRELAGTSRV